MTDEAAAGSDAISVLVVDDQAVIREGFRAFLSYADDIEVTGVASDGAEAAVLAGRLRPDVVLMDIRMPVLDGLSSARQILERNPSTRVIMLTTFDLDEYVFESLRLGASGFLLKDTTAEALAEAVRCVHRGGALLDPQITRRVIDTFVSKQDRPRPRSTELELLTEREKEVLRLIARGMTNAEIAAELYVSEGTTKTHVSNVLMKLGLRDRVQAVVLAYETGFVNSD